MKFKKVISLLLVAVMTLSLAGCGSNSSKKTEDAASTGTTASTDETASTADQAASGEKTKITVTYRETGTGEKNALYIWLKNAYDTWDLKDQVELDIAPITASEGDYFAKIALQLQSADTAPDLLTEDLFQMTTDVAAGYLSNMNDMVANYEDWNNGNYYENMKEGVTVNDGVYGVPYNTDTRGLWYNKDILQQAGITVPWQPKTWDDVLAACKAIKEKVPDVVPFWCNSGVATGEATSMQTYEMLLYGTGERLLTDDGKWIVGSQGILDSLNFINTIYSEGYGPSLSLVLNGQAGNTAANEYMPNGKLAICLDGSWMQGNYGTQGSKPWAEYADKLGFAAMPTQKGQDPATITMSGGWAWSIPELSDNKDMTMKFIEHLMNPDNYLTAIINMGALSTRTDIAKMTEYSSLPFMQTATDFLAGACFRPKNEMYSSVSTSIQTMVESVVSGTSPEDAMATYESDVTRTVGEENVIKK